LFSVNGRRRAGRTRRASGLDLRSCGRRNRDDGGSEYPAEEDAFVWFHFFVSVSRFGLIP
jgi:hypothetical protein